MKLEDMKEVPIDIFRNEELREREISLLEIKKYHIDHRLVDFIGDFPQVIKFVTGCWEYAPLKLIFEISGKFYLYEIGIPELREICFFDDPEILTDDQWNECFGYRLREAMWNKHMHRYELAVAAGISEVNLSRYINGLHTPKMNTVVRLANALDCTLEEFLPRDFYFV